MFAKMVVALAISTVTALASAQAYPVRPITVIVPFAAGGPGDALIRSFALALTKNLKQSLLIENAGIGGPAGLQACIKSEVEKWTSLLRAAGAPQE